MLDYLINLAVNGVVGYFSYKQGETRGKMISDQEYMHLEMMRLQAQIFEMKEEKKNTKP